MNGNNAKNNNLSEEWKPHTPCAESRNQQSQHEQTESASKHKDAVRDHITETPPEINHNTPVEPSDTQVESYSPQEKKTQNGDQQQGTVKSLISETITQVKEIVAPEIPEPEPQKNGKKKKRTHPLSMNLLFVIIILVEILIIVGSSSGILELVRSTLDENNRLPDFFWLACVCLVIGIATTVFLIRFFSAPIFTLGTAINKVAEGDLSVKLRTDKGFLEMRRINANFNTMVKELSATEIRQTDFISNVSHEFKTPITAIEGYATLLSGIEASSPEQAEYIEKILHNTNRLSTLVGNILLLSKVDNQAIPDKKAPFRLDEQIRQAILSLESAWTEKECELDVELDEISVMANEALLYHVWTNLIGNAIKFGPKGGLVKITLAKVDGVPTFTVSDEGAGIKDADKPHVFERFYQSDSSHKAEGNGIGLALVKQILRLEGGEVNVTDNFPHGATFTVTLGKQDESRI